MDYRTIIYSFGIITAFGQTGSRVMKDMGSIFDRRKWERIPLPVPLFVRGKDLNGEEFLDLTVAQNIGAGGLVFASHRLLARSARLTLHIPSAPWLRKLSSAQHDHALKGHVIRVTRAQDIKLYAFQFNRPLIKNHVQAKAISGDHQN